MRYIVCIVLLAAAGSAPAQVFSGNNSFSITNGNPNGLWSYGYRGIATGTGFNFLNVTSSSGPIVTWSLSNNIPVVSHNTDQVNPYDSGTATWAPNEMIMHPGSSPSTEYALLRFISPINGTVQITAMLAGRDDDTPATTDAHIVRNGIELTSGNMIGQGAGPTLTTTSVIASGDIIDFALGDGSTTSDFFNDSTGVYFTITAVPEPTSIFLCCAVAGPILGRRIWRRLRKID
ncbi:MAG: hypothetical protein ACJ8C4_15705 [Gemmataceae bacterium]